MKITADEINCILECIASLFLWFNVFDLYKHKESKGVNIYYVLFYLLWAIWTAFFYANLGQWKSFYGDLAMVVPNLTWAILMIYYKRK